MLGGGGLSRRAAASRSSIVRPHDPELAPLGHAAFEPRLPEQPIFYPVLSEAYAVKIARDHARNRSVTARAAYIHGWSLRCEVPVASTEWDGPQQPAARNSRRSAGLSAS